MSPGAVVRLCKDVFEYPGVWDYGLYYGGSAGRWVQVHDMEYGLDYTVKMPYASC